MIAQTAPASQERIRGQIIARAWLDEDFKNRLMLNPRVVLAEHGIELPGDTNVDDVEEIVRNLILPPPPVEELMEEELLEKSAAWCYCGHCGRCGCGCGRCGCYC